MLPKPRESLIFAQRTLKKPALPRIMIVNDTNVFVGRSKSNGNERNRE